MLVGCFLHDTLVVHKSCGKAGPIFWRTCRKIREKADIQLIPELTFFKLVMYNTPASGNSQEGLSQGADVSQSSKRHKTKRLTDL